MSFEINGTKLGTEFPPYIIAELSANHGGSISRAKKSIKAAKEAGANAVKIQSYTPDTMTIDCNKEEFIISGGIWSGQKLYDLYKKAYTPFEWHHELFHYAKEIGITIFSTPFDETAVDLLESLDAPAYKIASFELTDLLLIENVAKLKKPIFISTGMSELDEIAEALEVIKSAGNNKILIFHCISSYPAATEDSNLKNITFISNEFKTLVGLSDHTTNNLASSIAISLGACAIEKHFKLDARECGPDSSFSLLPKELSNLVENCNSSWKALGKNEFKRASSEIENKVFRRSLYFVKKISKGSVIQEGDIKRIRPGFGLPPKFYDEVIGKTLIKDADYGDPVLLDYFS